MYYILDIKIKSVEFKLSYRMEPWCKIVNLTLIMSAALSVFLIFLFLILQTDGEIKTEPSHSLFRLKRLISKFVVPQLEKSFFRRSATKNELSQKKILKEERKSISRSFQGIPQQHELQLSNNNPYYHYYHVSMDPINIMVTVSLMSLLFNTLGSLLDKIRLTMDSNLIERRYKKIRRSKLYRDD